jgi:hypothetical protein
LNQRVPEEIELVKIEKAIGCERVKRFFNAEDAENAEKNREGEDFHHEAHEEHEGREKIENT